MNYIKHYSLLIEKHVVNDSTQYSEIHHIIPKCMGGGDSSDNLVRLSAEAHYTAHLLLAKIHPQHKGVLFAARMMTVSVNNVRANNKLYKWVKEKTQKAMSDRMCELWKNEEFRQNIIETRKNSNQTPEVKENRKISHTECANRPEVKLKNSIAQKEAQNRPEVKQKRIIAFKNTTASPEFKLRHSNKQKETHNTLEVKIKLTKAGEKRWSNPDYKERQTRAQTTPEAMFKRRTATWNKNPAWKNAIEYFDLWILSNRPSAGVFKRKILQDRTEKCDQIIQLFHSGWVPALCDIYCSWVNTNSSIDKD